MLGIAIVPETLSPGSRQKAKPAERDRANGPGDDGARGIVAKQPLPLSVGRHLTDENRETCQGWQLVRIEPNVRVV